MLLFVIGSAAVGYLIYRASQDLPDYESLAKYEPPVMTRIHAHDGSLIAEYARERRIFVPINTIPKLLIAAFLSAEDRRFYEHGGIDMMGIARATVKYAERKMTGHGSIHQRAPRWKGRRRQHDHAAGGEKLPAHFGPYFRP